MLLKSQPLLLARAEVVTSLPIMDALIFRRLDGHMDCWIDLRSTLRNDLSFFPIQDILNLLLP
jgi:hypothetical protein